MNTAHIPNLPYIELFGKRVPRAQSLPSIALEPSFAQLTRRVMQAYPDTPIVTNYIPYATHLANRNLLATDDFDSAVVVSFAPRSDEAIVLPTSHEFNDINLFLGVDDSVGRATFPVEMHISQGYMYQANANDASRVTVKEIVVALRYV